MKPLQEKRDIRELPLPSESARRKDHVKTQGEEANYQSRRETSEETLPILDLRFLASRIVRK